MDIHGYPWISIDCHRYPSRIENILGNLWIKEICISMGNPKYFGYPWEIQIIIGFHTQNAKLEKLVKVHFMPTDSTLVQKVKL